VALALYASRIYDESLLPKRVLYDVPPEGYRVEVRKYVIVKFHFFSDCEKVELWVL
jgi:hypothetical protein